MLIVENWFRDVVIVAPLDVGGHTEGKSLQQGFWLRVGVSAEGIHDRVANLGDPLNDVEKAMDRAPSANLARRIEAFQERRAAVRWGICPPSTTPALYTVRA